jgi:putative MFS transporter
MNPIKTENSEPHPFFNKTVIVAALGYFVDVYDLVLFSIVRIASLKDLGFTGQELTDVGLSLLNLQMAGLLIGGIVWGSLGDKRGRLSVLFGSIALYSIANLLNAFVTTKEMYGVLRFAAGVGLAGELGAAVTLVSEILPVASRGYSTAFIAAVGILGAILAALTADILDWRVAYAVGGGLGICLLFARANIKDSIIFKQVKNSQVKRGNFLMMFRSWERAKRYLCTIAIGVPCWFVLGILLAFGPEITTEMGIAGTLIVGTGVMFQYAGAALGDLTSGVISQKIKSRNKVVLVSIVTTALLVAVFLLSRNMTPTFYYALYFGLGFTTGYWAVFVTIAAEQFGTNLRATAASTAPNFVRGSVIPMTLLIQFLRGHFGFLPSVIFVGVLVLGLALFALSRLKDSYASDLDFVET